KLLHDIAFRVLYTQLTRRRYDVVHFFRNGWNTFLPLKLLSLRRQRSVVVDDWADLWTDGVLQRPLGRGWRRLDFRVTGGLEERSCRAADGVTVNSSYLADRAEGLGVPRDRILLVREGAFTHRIRPRPKTEARQSLEI